MTRERDVALTLSDAFCVDRYRAEFLDLIRTGTVDLVFANERELHSLYETADFDTALNALRGDAKLAVVTRSEKGCLVVTREETEAVPAVPVERVVDATGAGDLFAAGFLVGLARGEDYRDCARLGALAAAEVISHLGRTAGDLAQGAGAAERLRPRRVRQTGARGSAQTGRFRPSSQRFTAIHGGLRRAMQLSWRACSYVPRGGYRYPGGSA